jgi:hypothetical protein
MMRLIWSVAFVGTLFAAGEARAETPPVEGVEALVRCYVAGFMSPATDLAYGVRINGPRGLAALESPAEIAARRVRGVYRPWGYGAGMEDVAYQNGMLLFALCDAEEASGNPYFAQLARRVAAGLRHLSTLSPVPGFVPRGPHPDGKSYYPDSSRDQHSLYVCGLWRYYHSRLATAADKEWIRTVTGQILERLEKNGWSILAEDDAVEAHAGGSVLHPEPMNAALLFVMLAAAHDVTGDVHWQEVYERFGHEKQGIRWKLLDTEIDRTAKGRWDLFSNQDALRTETLRRIESRPERQAILRRRLERTAADMLGSPYFESWARASWTTPENDAEANAFLQPLGVTVASGTTVLDLWRKFDTVAKAPGLTTHQRRRFDYLTLTSPFEVCQVALLSEQPESVRQAQTAVREMLHQVDFQQIHSGWSSNYAVVAALWSLARSR